MIQTNSKFKSTPTTGASKISSAAAEATTTTLTSTPTKRDIATFEPISEKIRVTANKRSKV